MASGAIPALTLAPADALADGGGGSALATGAIGSLTLTSTAATATGDGSATGQIPGLILVAPAASASGGSAASAALETLTLDPATGTATGGSGGSATGGLGILTLIAPDGAAHAGFSVILTADLAGIGWSATADPKRKMWRTGEPRVDWKAEQGRHT